MILDEEYAKAVLAQVDELKAHIKRTKDPNALADMAGNEAPLGFRR